MSSSRNGAPKRWARRNSKLSDSQQSVKSLTKALRILDVLGDSPSGLGITELSRVFQNPKSTVHRLLTTLKAEGYVVFEPSTSRYMLGTRVAKLGEQLFRQSPVLNFGVPILERLTITGHETGLLAILEGTDVVYGVCREESAEPHRISFGMGYRAPAHCTALGKACLCGFTDTEITKLYKHRKHLNQFTPQTVVKTSDLLRQLAKVRSEGIAHDNQEYIAQVRCIAVPIRDFSSKIVAAMGLSTPSHRMTPRRQKLLINALLEAGAELCGKLGFPQFPNSMRSRLVVSALSPR